MLFGLAPALRYARADSGVALRDGERSTAEGFALGRYLSLRGALVVAEIGLAMVLLAGGGLLIRSFVKLSSVDTGYDPSNVMTFQVAVPGDLYRRLGRRRSPKNWSRGFDPMPGVRSAAYANQLPMVSLVNSYPL